MCIQSLRRYFHGRGGPATEIGPTWRVLELGVLRIGRVRVRVRVHLRPWHRCTAEGSQIQCPHMHLHM